MELYAANRILRSVKAAAAADGFKLPSSAETDGLLMLLDRLDAEKYINGIVKRTATYARGSAAFKRTVGLLAFFRALSAVEKGLTEQPSVTSLCALNKTLYADCDENTGKLRLSDAYTNGNAHTDPKYIAGSVKAITTKMNETVGAPTTAKEDFAVYLSHYMRELIILHPFERGSEFTVRIFILMFCRSKGFALDYYRASPSTVKSAETDAFAADDITPLYALLSECLSYDYKTTATAPSPGSRKPSDAKKEKEPPRKSGARKPSAKKQSESKPELTEDEIIIRAVRLQQKISKLNEQLTELMRPIEEAKRSTED